MIINDLTEVCISISFTEEIIDFEDLPLMKARQTLDRFMIHEFHDDNRTVEFLKRQVKASEFQRLLDMKESDYSAEIEAYRVEMDNMIKYWLSKLVEKYPNTYHKITMLDEESLKGLERLGLHLRMIGGKLLLQPEGHFDLA